MNRAAKSGPTPKNERRDWSDRQRAIVHLVLLTSTRVELEMLLRMFKSGLLLMNEGPASDTRRTDLAQAIKHTELRLKVMEA